MLNMEGVRLDVRLLSWKIRPATHGQLYARAQPNGPCLNDLNPEILTSTTHRSSS